MSQRDVWFKVYKEVTVSFYEMRTDACAVLVLCIQSYLMTLYVFHCSWISDVNCCRHLWRSHTLETAQIVHQSVQETRWREKEWQWQETMAILFWFPDFIFNRTCQSFMHVLSFVDRCVYNLTVLLHNELEMFIFEVWYVMFSNLLRCLTPSKLSMNAIWNVHFSDCDNTFPCFSEHCVGIKKLFCCHVALNIKINKIQIFSILINILDTGCFYLARFCDL